MTNYEQLENLLKHKIDFSSRTLFIHGEITDDSAEVFLRGLHLLSKSDGVITIQINSIGGDWDFAGNTMLSAILSSQHEVTTEVLGAAASSAALIFLAGDIRKIHRYAYLMYHDGSIGDLDVTIKELGKTSELLLEQCDHTHQFLEARSNRPATYWKENLAEDFYIFSEKALDLGLATEILG